jgi:drug/metabolite transporter (DMT)-like permease
MSVSLGHTGLLRAGSALYAQLQQTEDLLSESEEAEAEEEEDSEGNEDEEIAVRGDSEVEPDSSHGDGARTHAARQPPPPKPAGWVGIAILVNLAFGLLPCFARYLVGPPSRRLQLKLSDYSGGFGPGLAGAGLTDDGGVALNVSAAVSAARAATTAAALANAAATGGLPDRRPADDTAPSVSSAAGVSAYAGPAAALTLTAVGQTGAALIVLAQGAFDLRGGWSAGHAGGRGKPALAGDAGGGRGRGLLRNPVLSFRYGCVTCVRAATNVMSAQYTAAYNAQLVGMLAPFVTALVSRIATGERLPRAMWPALATSVLGAGLVVLQQGTTATTAGDDAGGGGLVGSDAVGMGLQFVAVLAQACIRVDIQRTRGRLSPRELLMLQYVFATTMFVLATSVPGSPLALDGGAWLPWVRISPHEWFVVVLFTVTCMWFAAEYQVATVRKLGPAFTAALQPVRLISTVLASWIWLNEPVQGTLEWLGLALVFVSITAVGTMGCVPTKRQRPQARPREALAHEQADGDPQAHSHT